MSLLTGPKQKKQQKKQWLSKALNEVKHLEQDFLTKSRNVWNQSYIFTKHPFSLILIFFNSLPSKVWKSNTWIILLRCIHRTDFFFPVRRRLNLYKSPHLSNLCSTSDIMQLLPWEAPPQLLGTSFAYIGLHGSHMRTQFSHIHADTDLLSQQAERCIYSFSSSVVYRICV